MRKVFRSSGQAFSSAAVGIAVFTVVVGHALNLHQQQEVVRVLEVLPAAAFCFICYRFFMAGVYVDAHGVEVVNVLGRRSIPWSEIQEFTVRRYRRMPAVAYLLLRSGPAVRLEGIRSGGGRFFRNLSERSVTKHVDELNRVLERAGSRPRQSGWYN